MCAREPSPCVQENRPLVCPREPSPCVSGGLIGYNSGSATNCSASNAVCGGSNVGGFVGWLEVGNIELSSATSVVSGTESIGGFIGRMRRGIVKNCYAAGDATATSNYAGGFCGYQRNDASYSHDDSKIINCYSKVKCTAPSNKGGFCASAYYVGAGDVGTGDVGTCHFCHVCY